jgi:formylglycine-generating enzyme required for sulfatase activity
MADDRPTNTSTDTAGETLHGHNGGVWEWTSTELSGLEGYTASELYPGFSADFFDGKHFVVVSFAPRSP